MKGKKLILSAEDNLLVKNVFIIEINKSFCF